MTENTQIKVDLSEEKEYQLIEVAGDISYSVTSVFQEKLNIALETQKTNILIDLSQTAYISSAGLRILLKFGKMSQQKIKTLFFAD